MRVTTSLSPYTFRMRSRMWWIVSWKSCCTSPSSMSPLPPISRDSANAKRSSALVGPVSVLVEVAPALVLRLAVPVSRDAHPEEEVQEEHRDPGAHEQRADQEPRLLVARDGGD